MEQRARMDPVQMLPDRAFIKKFRLSKALFKDLVEDLSPFIYFGGHGGALSAETKVMMSLLLLVDDVSLSQL